MDRRVDLPCARKTPELAALDDELSALLHAMPFAQWRNKLLDALTDMRGPFGESLSEPFYRLINPLYFGRRSLLATGITFAQLRDAVVAAGGDGAALESIARRRAALNPRQRTFEERRGDGVCALASVRTSATFEAWRDALFFRRGRRRDDTAFDDHVAFVRALQRDAELGDDDAARCIAEAHRVITPLTGHYYEQTRNMFAALPGALTLAQIARALQSMGRHAAARDLLRRCG